MHLQCSSKPSWEAMLEMLVIAQLFTNWTQPAHTAIVFNLVGRQCNHCLLKLLALELHYFIIIWYHLILNCILYIFSASYDLYIEFIWIVCQDCCENGRHRSSAESSEGGLQCCLYTGIDAVWALPSKWKSCGKEGCKWIKQWQIYIWLASIDPAFSKDLMLRS